MLCCLLNILYVVFQIENSGIYDTVTFKCALGVPYIYHSLTFNFLCQKPLL